MDDKEEEYTNPKDPQPTILESEEKIIEERKPPNDKILYFNLEGEQ